MRCAVRDHQAWLEAPYEAQARYELELEVAHERYYGSDAAQESYDEYTENGGTLRYDEWVDQIGLEMFREWLIKAFSHDV